MRSNLKRKDVVTEAFVELERSFMSTRGAETLKLYSLGLTHGQFNVLELLMSKGEQKIGTIIKLLFSTPGNITVVIKNLELKGLIKTYSDSHDKRIKMATMTDEGKKIVDEVNLVRNELLESFFAKLTNDEMLTLIGLLQKVMV